MKQTGNHTDEIKGRKEFLSREKSQFLYAFTGSLGNRGGAQHRLLPIPITSRRGYRDAFESCSPPCFPNVAPSNLVAAEDLRRRTPRGVNISGELRSVKPRFYRAVRNGTEECTIIAGDSRRQQIRRKLSTASRKLRSAGSRFRGVIVIPSRVYALARELYNIN